MSVWDKIVDWFKHGNKPCVAEQAIKLAAVGLHEAVRDIKKLDKTLTDDVVLQKILDEYKK